MNFNGRSIEEYTEEDFKLAKRLVQAKKESTSKRAEHIVNNLMPIKILYLEKLFEDTKNYCIDSKTLQRPISTSFFSLDDVRSVHTKKVPFEDMVAAPSASLPVPKKRKVESMDTSKDSDGSTGNAEKKIVDFSSYPKIPINQVCSQLFDIIKMEILQIIEYCNTVKIWVQLSIPKIEDGNNFGVSIQEETVNELSRAEDSCFSVMDQIAKYHVTRAKLVSKLYKYPNVDDYHKALDELDEKEYINLRMMFMEMRNNYAILYDIITKNIDKIRKPRSQNSSNLY